MALTLLFPVNNHHSMTSHAKTPKITFKRTYNTIYTSQKKRYTILNLKKGYTCQYQVTPKNIATISAHKGILKAKKAGTVIVTATIYNTHKRRIQTLKDTVKIINRKKLLPNATFHLKGQINPWNFTITLSCNRILLKKEVKHTTITLQNAKQKKWRYKATFSGISSNGKKITYTLSSSAQKKLCPKNDSKNGIYYVSSDSFSKIFKTRYQERISKNTIAGFTLQTNGQSLANAKLTLTCKNKTYTVKSDKNGHYIFHAVKNPLSLSVQKTGYISQSISLLSSSTKGSLCENFILASSSPADNNHALAFYLHDSNNHPIKDASVYVTKTYDSTVIFSGKSDSSGKLLFCNDTNLQKGDCSVITYDQNPQLHLRQDYTPDFSNRYIISETQLNASNSYTIHIKKEPSEKTDDSYQSMHFSFSYKNLMTKYAFFSLSLTDCSAVSFNHVSLKWDTSLLIEPSYSVTLQIYNPISHNSFFEETILLKTTNSTYLSSLLTEITDLYLPDDTYYLQLKVLDSNQNIKGISPVVPMVVNNGLASCPSITIQPPMLLRALNYCEYGNTINTASYDLYQKSDSSYFYQGNFRSDSFAFSSSEYLTSNLLLPYLCLNTEYVLIPKKDSVFADRFYTFTPISHNTVLTGPTASLPSPALQIHCINSLYHTFYSSLPADFSIKKSANNARENFSITQDFVRTCQTYPNSVTAIYKSNGTLASLILSNSTDTVLPTSKGNKKLITDVYTNGKFRKTNQHSYHK